MPFCFLFLVCNASYLVLILNVFIPKRGMLTVKVVAPLAVMASTAVRVCPNRSVSSTLFAAIPSVTVLPRVSPLALNSRTTRLPSLSMAAELSW